LGAGGVRCVRWNGRLYEATVARREHRGALDLYHSALQVQLGSDRYVIEMAPVWRNTEPERGVVGEGAVALPWLGRSRLFRYEVRRWHNGVIPDIAEADRPRRRAIVIRLSSHEDRRDAAHVGVGRRQGDAHLAGDPGVRPEG
jgi:hypothetical protein